MQVIFVKYLPAFSMSTNAVRGQRQGRGGKGRNDKPYKANKTNFPKHPLIKDAHWNKKESSPDDNFAGYTIAKDNIGLKVTKEGSTDRYIEIDGQEYNRVVIVVDSKPFAMVVVGEGDDREAHIYGENIFGSSDYYHTTYKSWLKHQNKGKGNNKDKTTPVDPNRAVVVRDNASIRGRNPREKDKVNVTLNVDPVMMANMARTLVGFDRDEFGRKFGDTLPHANPFSNKTASASKVVWSDITSNDDEPSEDAKPEPKLKPKIPASTRRSSIEDVYCEFSSSETKSDVKSESSEGKKKWAYTITPHYNLEAAKGLREDKKLKAGFAGIFKDGDKTVVTWALILTDKRCHVIVHIFKNKLDMYLTDENRHSEPITLVGGDCPLGYDEPAYIHYSNYSIARNDGGRDVRSLLAYLERVITLRGFCGL